LVRRRLRLPQRPQCVVGRYVPLTILMRE
jgi:hypothetical protein